MIGPAYLVGVGGVLGAILRHLVTGALEHESIPLGTFTVNVLGSFVLGLVTFLSVGDRVVLLVGTGACGSFTTFSSFSVDVVRLWEDDEQVTSLAYAAANLVGALGAIGVAWLVVAGVQRI